MACTLPEKGKIKQAEKVKRKWKKNEHLVYFVYLVEVKKS